MPYAFTGHMITDEAFAEKKPRNVFHRQLEKLDLPPDERQDSHILFRRHFSLQETPKKAMLYITADDYYKLYLGGRFVAQGPTMANHNRYGYNEIDVTGYLSAGENLLAVHTYYQGLINRVWQSGDGRHGLLCDLVVDGEVVLSSDESFLTHRHTGYTAIGKLGYDTQFSERYDSRAAEVGFSAPGFDDSGWCHASRFLHADYTLLPQQSAMLVFDEIQPVTKETRGKTLFVDFGATYVGYLRVRAHGKAGTCLRLRYGQELLEDGSVRHEMRCNCVYQDEWILSGGEDELHIFDYKSFRYAEIIGECEILSLSLAARHYPFSLQAAVRPEYAEDPDIRRIWELCVHSQHYGVQEVIQDCMDREKGFYLGDGCYTALTHMILCGDDSMVRKMIDDAFHSTFITDGLVTCMGCSFMQEIAEYPLMLISLILWHYRLKGDQDYLKENYKKIVALLETYRRDYEKDCLLCDLDKWCVVEWPANFRDGYAADIKEGQICHEAHVALNAYYIEAIHTANEIADILGENPYRDEAPLRERFVAAFYDEEQHLFCDGVEHRHISYIGNVYPFAFRLCPDEASKESILRMIRRRGMAEVSLFGSFALLQGLVRAGRSDMIKGLLLDEGAWLRMLREGATTTYEGWGRDTKWNTSLFHLTLSDAAVFIADVDLEKLFA